MVTPQRTGLPLFLPGKAVPADTEQGGMEVGHLHLGPGGQDKGEFGQGDEEPLPGNDLTQGQGSVLPEILITAGRPCPGDQGAELPAARRGAELSGIEPVRMKEQMRQEGEVRTVEVALFQQEEFRQCRDFPGDRQNRNRPQSLQTLGSGLRVARCCSQAFTYA